MVNIEIFITGEVGSGKGIILREIAEFLESKKFFTKYSAEYRISAIYTQNQYIQYLPEQPSEPSDG